MMKRACVVGFRVLLLMFCCADQTDREVGPVTDR